MCLCVPALTAPASNGSARPPRIVCRRCACRSPSAQLADAQLAVAREHGFRSWRGAQGARRCAGGGARGAPRGPQDAARPPSATLDAAAVPAPRRDRHGRRRARPPRRRARRSWTPSARIRSGAAGRSRCTSPSRATHDDDVRSAARLAAPALTASNDAYGGWSPLMLTAQRGRARGCATRCWHAARASASSRR